jgi:RNA polymerase sigma factor (TIGR02999 family)
MSPSRTVTQILADLSDGDRSAVDELIPLVYEELRRLAAQRLRRSRPNHTLQATALVNEAYLKLVEQREVRWQNRAHFLAVAATVMRRLLKDYARGREAEKRLGQRQRVPFEDALRVVSEQGLDPYSLDEALTALEALDARQYRVVELRFFSDMSVEEVAEVLGLSPTQVKRDTRSAKAFLRHHMGREGGDDA